MALGDAAEGRGRLEFLVGEAGIGKTRTAAEFARRAQIRGARVLWGRCPGEAAGPAFWPWREVLRVLLDDAALHITHAAPGTELVRTLVQDSHAPSPVDPLATPVAVRFRQFDALMRFLRPAADVALTFLVRYALHWVDEISLRMLAFLSRGITVASLLVVGTYRDAEMRRSPILADVLGAVDSQSGHIRLGGLDATDVAELIETLCATRP